MKIFHIALNTLFQAGRMKFALAFVIFLSAVIVLVPFMLKSDGTQRGMVQISLAYSVSVLNIILSFLVIFLSTTVFCADLRDKVIFTIDSKPVRRWQIMAGKWLGVMMLNAIVLTVLGGAVYGLVRYMGRAGVSDEQDYLILRSEVLTARAQALPESGRGQREFIVAYNTEYTWTFAGVRPAAGEQYFNIRFKQHSAAAAEEDEEIQGLWVIGDITGDYHIRALSFPEGESNEFRVPVDVISADGTVDVRWRNLSSQRASVIFPAADMKVLYTAGSFGPNLFRGMLLIFIRLSFLTVMGLAASTFLTFPVATLLTLFIFVMSLSLPTIIALFMPGAPAPGAQALEHHNILFLNIRAAMAQSLRILPNLRSYDPVPMLIDGVMITWMSVLKAFFTTFILRSAAAGLLGVLIFNRRELAHMGYE